MSIFLPLRSYWASRRADHKLMQLGLAAGALLFAAVAPTDASACSGPQYGYYKASFPTDGVSDVPINVRPLFFADPPAAVGLFDEDGIAVPLEVALIAATPSPLDEGEDEDGNPIVFDTHFTNGVYQVRPAEALQPDHAYEMLVVMGQVDLDEIVVLETHPAQWVSDAGGGEAGIELFWPPEFEGQESELEPRSLNFVTGTVADEQAPAPPDQVWMSHGLFEHDQGSSCLSSERICFGNVEAGERLLADLVFELDGETIESSVLVTRDTTYMSLSRNRDELLSATLVVMDEAGNRSDSVTLTRDDIPHNTIPAEYDDGSLRYCDAQRAEGEWHSTDEPLFEDDAGSSSGDDAGLVEAGTPLDASTPTEASAEPPNDDGAAPEQPMTDASPDDSHTDDSEPDDSDTDDGANADDPPDDSDDDSTSDDDDAPSDAGTSPSGADDSSDDGCGCRAAGSGTSGSSPHWAVLFLAAVGVLRRRRIA